MDSATETGNRLDNQGKVKEAEAWKGVKGRHGYRLTQGTDRVWGTGMARRGKEMNQPGTYGVFGLDG